MVTGVRSEEKSKWLILPKTRQTPISGHSSAGAALFEAAAKILPDVTDCSPSRLLADTIDPSVSVSPWQGSVFCFGSAGT